MTHTQGWFTPALASKDVRLAVGLADRAEIGVRIGPATDTLLSAVIDTAARGPISPPLLRRSTRRNSTEPWLSSTVAMIVSSSHCRELGQVGQAMRLRPRPHP